MAKDDAAFEITFVNHAWAQVNLEVVTGRFQVCEKNDSLGVVTLMRNQDKTINTADSVVCWRRTADPDNPESSWGDWFTINPDAENTPMTVDLS